MITKLRAEGEDQRRPFQEELGVREVGMLKR